MNGNDLREVDDISNVNSSDIVNHVHSDNDLGYNENLNSTLTDEVETEHLKTQFVHRHNSKCYNAEVFMHGIAFILQRRVQTASPCTQKNESIPSADDGYVEDSRMFAQWSGESEQSQIISRGTSSEGYQEMEGPAKVETNLEKVLSRLNDQVRLTICDSCTGLPKFSKSFYMSLEHVLIFFQDKYHSCQWLNYNTSQLNDTELSEARDELCSIYQSMFSDRINWGRIIAMIGFVAELSVCALSAERYELMEEYLLTSVRYVEDNLMAWIVDHGGWEGLVDFQTGQTNIGTDIDHMFGSLGRIAGVAALALAGVAICKFVADHI